MEEETQSAAKRHLPLPRTVEISIARFLHVDDGNLFVVVLILLFFFVFSSRERPSSSTCCYGFVREREGKCRCRLSKETDGRLCWTTVQTSSAQLLGGGSQRRSAGASQILQYPPCSWYDGTWTFSLYRSPSDLSRLLSPTPWPLPPLSPASSQHTWDRIYRVTLPGLSYGCLYACCLCLFGLPVRRKRQDSENSWHLFSLWGQVKFHLQTFNWTLFSKQTRHQIKTL